MIYLLACQHPEVSEYKFTVEQEEDSFDAAVLSEGINAGIEYISLIKSSELYKIYELSMLGGDGQCPGLFTSVEGSMAWNNECQSNELWDYTGRAQLLYFEDDEFENVYYEQYGYFISNAHITEPNGSYIVMQGYGDLRNNENEQWMELIGTFAYTGNLLETEWLNKESSISLRKNYDLQNNRLSINGGVSRTTIFPNGFIGLLLDYVELNLTNGCIVEGGTITLLGVNGQRYTVQPETGSSCVSCSIERTKFMLGSINVNRGKFMVGVLLIIACSPEQIDLSNQELLTRLSIDLRGYRPSLDEFEASISRGWSKEDTIEEFIAGSDFAHQIAQFYAPIYNTRQDETLYSAEEFSLLNEFSFAYSVGDEPLRIIEEVISNDLPWPTIVTSDWTMVNEDLASIYPVTYPEGGQGWLRAKYVDGRPSAGVLSTNGLWWRYETSRNNASRARANQISRILLCNDYLDKEIRFDRNLDLSNEQLMQEALENDPGCVSCHSSLDPLASFLGGVFVPRKSGSDEMIYYHPERESIWREQTGVSPAYYGVSGQDLADLGRMIASDPEFAQCTVEQVSQFLTRSEFNSFDVSELNTHREQFIKGNLAMKSLVKSVVSSTRYQSSLFQSQSTYRVVSPIQMASQIEHITGFRFISDGYDMMLSETMGLYSMAGGGDGQYSSNIGNEISVPMILIQRQIAAMAVEYWVENNSNTIGFEVDEEYDEETLSLHLNQMHIRILSREATKDELKELYPILSIGVGFL